MILTMLLLAAAGVAVRMEQVAEEKRILDEVEARHRETVKRMEAYQKDQMKSTPLPTQRSAPLNLYS